MQPAVLIRLRPTGPWRFGPGDGGDTRLDFTFRSDRLYSAVTLAMRNLGFLEEWLDATARRPEPAVTFSSLFPFQTDVLFAPPPASLWPPAASLVVSPSPVFLSKLRWSAARFVPLSVVETILTGQSLLADQWIPDPESGCLLRRDRPSSSPFRAQTRSGAAVDRLGNGAAEINSRACVEFESGSGLWTLARYADAQSESEWNSRVEAAFRLLADSGFGARRTSGWGQAETPEFQRGEWPKLLFPKLSRRAIDSSGSDENASEPSLYWLLALFVPASTDGIDWSSGDYRLVRRGGFVENGAASGAAKKALNMIAEGSVIACAKEPVGTAVDVAPDGFPHPAYRAGFAFALKLPTPGPEAPDIVEAPPGEQLGGPGEELPPCAPESSIGQPPSEAETEHPAETPEIETPTEPPNPPEEAHAASAQAEADTQETASEPAPAEQPEKGEEAPSDEL